MRTLSTAAKREIFATQSGAVFLTLLQISHTSITTQYLVNNHQNVVFDGNTYTGYAFKFTPPKDGESVNQNSKLMLPNIDRTFVSFVRSLTTPLTVRAAMIMVLPDNTASKEAGWWEYKMKNISYDALTVSGDLEYTMEFGNNISMMKYNNVTFPGIYR